MIITKSAEGEVIQTGGVTRIQHGAPDPTTQQPLESTHQTTRVGTGALRFSGGEVVSVGPTRYQVGSEAPTPTSVLATRRQEGAHDTVELVPGVAASRTDIKAALRHGLIRETFPGCFEDVAAQQAASGEQQEAPEVQEATTHVFDQNEAAIWAEHIEPLDQGTYDQAVAGTIAAIAADGDLEGVARTLAQSGALEPEFAQELVDTGVEWYRGTLTRDLVKQGLCTPGNVEEFYEAARRHPRLKEAMLEFANQGRTDTFRSMASEWKRGGALRAQEATGEQLSQAGMQTTVDPRSGELLVKRGSGGWVPLSAL